MKDDATAHPETEAKGGGQQRGRLVRIGTWSFRLPRSKALRLLVGIAFVLGGIVGFLPVVGFWMIPIGLLILSNDIPRVRRWRRRLEVRFGRRSKPKV